MSCRCHPTWRTVNYRDATGTHSALRAPIDGNSRYRRSAAGG
jgi:hypothetical protein